MGAHRDRVTTLAHTTLDMGNKLDAVIRTQGQQGAVMSEHSAMLTMHGAQLSAIAAGQARLEGLLSKILEGQAVLHQNDMELKRRLDTIGGK